MAHSLLPGFLVADIATSGGARIHVRHAGSGPPLLLMHGNPQTHVSWHRIAPRLAERFHVVTIDLRGYGDSIGPDPADTANYSFRAMAQDGVEVMRALGHESFLVAGHNRGARVAHRMADREQGGFWTYLLWFAALIAGSALVGFLLASIIFFAAFLRWPARCTWTTTLTLTAIANGALVVVANILVLDFPSGLLQSLVDLPWPLR